MTFSIAEWITVVMAVAIGLVLILVAFNRKMPPRMRRAMELMVSIGYPALVAVFFAVLAWSRYRQGDDGAATGFAVGGALMVVLIVRAWRRGRKHT